MTLNFMSDTTSVDPDEDMQSSQLEDQEKAMDGICAPQDSNNDLTTRNSRPSRLSITSLKGGRYGDNKFDHPLASLKTTEEFIVDFEGPNDPYNAINWPRRRKIITTVLYGLTTMGATWASAVYSPAIGRISQEFEVDEETATLGISFILFGFGLGPLLWAPLSEVYGRKWPILVPYAIGIFFTFGTATAKDIQTILITRFFTGFFSSAPLTITGGVLGDIFPPETRGAAVVGYSLAVVGGPVLGPVAGGAIMQSNLDWRWTEHVTGIYMSVILLLDVFYLSESYAPVLLVYKAQSLRHKTGNWALHARHETWNVSIKELFVKFMIRPFQMLVNPICFFVALYTSFVYGIVYLNLGSFPILFQQARGWNEFVGQLPFLALAIGIGFGAVVNIFNQTYYVKEMRANDGKAVPEARLPPMMAGSIMMAAALFVMGWTSDKDLPWIAPCIGAAMMGFGFFTIFQNAINYLVDTFKEYSASAIAANTFLRSVIAGAFPLTVKPLYHNLGIHWASSLLGFFAVAMIPIPYLFFAYGKRIRAKGKWSAGSV